MQPSKLKSLLILGLLGSSAIVRADFVGLNIGAKYWSPDASGTFNSTSNGPISLQNDLGVQDSDRSTALSISIEHPLPGIPNLKYQGFELNSSGSSVTSSNLTFNRQTYATGSSISSTLDLSHNDIVLYYEVLDNWVNLDLGLDFKMFDGRVSIDDELGSNSVDVNETIPLLYISARFDLPLTGMYVGANLQTLNIGDSSAQDSTLLVGYETNTGLGVEGGFKTFNLELDDAGDLDTNLEYEGIFLNGYFRF